jgi:Fe-Mn family superoxide dismutase
MYNFIKTIVEGRTPKTLERIKLPYALDGLGRSLSKRAVNYHYNKLYKAYCDRYNAGEGDLDFNESGAFLHAKYFSQFTAPKGNNTPTGACLNFINESFDSFENFKDRFLKVAMAVQGSGWVYLARNGEIKTITNHQIKNDIVLLIDWWEHSFQFDFENDKEKYLEGQWRIIDWSVIEQRL